MKRMPKTCFINNLASWLFITALLTLAAITTYGVVYAIIIQSKLPEFFIYIGAGAVVMGYVALVILAFINFVIDA
jgi:hypothetical protein|nr:MAG TPA: hypothetical protein [Caudoviricetes sp.]